MASDHTTEPWKTGRKDMQSYHGDTGEPFSSVYRASDDERMPMISDGFGGKVRAVLRIATIDGKDVPREEEKANADRIVACVNACAGLSDPAAALAAKDAEIWRLRGALSIIDTMPVDGCSPSVIESILRQAKTLAHTALAARAAAGEGA
jgi:hypothetical protein